MEHRLHAKKQIIIVGAGTAGLYLAQRLKTSSTGLDVIVIEEHSHLKKTCSGILTSSIKNILQVPEYIASSKPSKKKGRKIILAKVSKARIFSPSENFVPISFKDPDIIVDREAFNEYLMKRAEAAGCKIFLGMHFEKIAKDNQGRSYVVLSKNGKQQAMHADILVGADGALSSVAKTAGLWNPEERVFYQALKAKIKLDTNNQILFYPYIKDFAWISPLGKNSAEIGIARKFTNRPSSNIKHELDLFAKAIEDRFGKKIKMRHLESALIPEYRKVQLHKKMPGMDIYLVGDSALQVKATTLGGIIPNLQAADALADAILKKKSYSALLRKLDLELYMHKKARQVFSKFEDKHWNDLIKSFSDPKLTNILNEVSRDDPKKLAVKILARKPSMIRYARYLF